jgi:hypothetical protein
VAAHPVFEFLRAQRRSEEVATRPQHRDEQFGLEVQLQRDAVVDRYSHAGKVDEEFTALMVLAHDDVDVAAPASVEKTELAVGVAVGVVAIPVNWNTHSGVLVHP